jgi:Txe/YoeB family toxin of Txe-Axe toxin-antitoxin module
MTIKPLKKKIKDDLKRYQLEKKFEKAKTLFEQNIQHPSLHVELLEPKYLKVYSFRLDKKYRVLFIVLQGEVEVVAITSHYQ